jgi:hypothetical protein
MLLRENNISLSVFGPLVDDSKSFRTKDMGVGVNL